MFSEIPPSGMVINEMLKMTSDYKNNIFCILGVSKDTETIKSFLNYSVSSKIEYVLLRENDITAWRTRFVDALMQTHDSVKAEA